MRICRKMMRGQSMVELAVALPFLAILLVVVADFARVFYMSITVADAARAGVQYGSQSYLTAIDYTAIQDAALNDAQNISGVTATASDFCQCSGVTVSCAATSPCAQPDVFVQVEAQATFHTLLNYPGVPSSIPVSSTAVMQVKP